MKFASWLNDESDTPAHIGVITGKGALECCVKAWFEGDSPLWSQRNVIDC